MPNGFTIARNIRFRHIRCFIEVATEKNISRAAENLGTGQPALSRTLKEYAELLSARLFACTKGGLELTDAGKIFLKYASGGMALSQTVIFGHDGTRHCCLSSGQYFELISD